MKYRTFVLFVAISSVAIAEDHGRAEKVITQSRYKRALDEDTTADIMARNILEWIQGLYRHGSRKPRQQSENAYLPPYSTQRPPEKPRPFQPATTPGYPSPNINEVSGVQKPSTSFVPPEDGYSSNRPFPPFGTSSSSSPYGPSTSNGQSPSGPSYGPSSSNPYGPSSSGPSSSGSPYGPSFPTSSAPKPFSPSPATSTTYLPPKGGPPPVQTDSYPDYSYPSPDETPQTGYPSSPSEETSSAGSESPSTPQVGMVPSTRPTNAETSGTTPGITPGMTPGVTSSGSSGGTTSPGIAPTEPFDNTESNGVDTGPEDDDLKHPPHIHAIDVQCSKEMMTINIEFNRQFDGLIYSKGYYMNPECRYVEQNSGQKEYKFTVNLNSCGTQFINEFEGEAGQAYLENVLVLQNEPGIQEVWDTIRSVRCLWEGNINKALTVSLSVDMLNQEIVTFSGDTASAKLDIQVGKGPFAPAATGLVKIGETMTLVVSVEGDPGFDLHVRDCIARDESSTNIVQLTDDRGCILKPKFFGAFQKTKETGNSGASIIAYAFFQAFKFPDVMDLFIECNVELCKTACESCPDSNQQIDPGRRRRSIMLSSNSSVDVASAPVKVTRGFKVVMPEDLSPATTQALRDISDAFVKDTEFENHICLCNGSFYAAFTLMFVALTLTTVSAAIFYAKLYRVHSKKCDFS